ncbi:glutathione S-transferase family protein [Paraburkholderia hospita]|uniref:Glutathione S-transferase domain-containing protein n=1 Tax=Paraburkholderia hospita TaxID=169430 RepID=A0AAN1JJM2_9BURK|nr:glutathione S-transferase family protein [Paraburkholderia hospita]AUT74940.1 glutathione S-transferase family protein [Paraburkholderia hospita]EIM94907.1 glutathione S-transferase domain-containing protein [Paraburkholderia hospita]OUL77587.1 glutathione S-transferase [Paraburkholderia hospita]OUL91995.1 glutathione S-transferase [Paraburkholderia hospita]SEH70362.1 Glutathione S-transferase [Paraburkholderia hospita]
MKLIGPWFSGYTRRVGITLKLLGIPFEHLPYHAYEQKDLIRPFSPMVKVPALVLDEGEILYDSASIIDYLHEEVGPARALLATSGARRRDALQFIGIASAIYGKLSDIYDESIRPPERQIASITESLREQALSGFTMLESRAGDGWLIGDALSQADVLVVITYQSASLAMMPDVVNQVAFPKLAQLAARAMELEAFSSTLPFKQT